MFQNIDIRPEGYSHLQIFSIKPESYAKISIYFISDQIFDIKQDIKIISLKDKIRNMYRYTILYVRRNSDSLHHVQIADTIISDRKGI